MYNNVFCGNKVAAQKKKVLILGESHYGTTNSTQSVIENYWNNYNNRNEKRDKAYRFFENIVRTFGYVPDKDREAFWNCVYFGNYVEELCGVGDRRAKNAIFDHRNEYNEHLFRFIRDNKIDMVFCFSRLVFNNLPQAEKPELWQKSGGGRSRIEWCTYNRITIVEETIQLEKPVIIYGLQHASSYYSWSRFQDGLKKINEGAIIIE